MRWDLHTKSHGVTFKADASGYADGFTYTKCVRSDNVFDPRYSVKSCPRSFMASRSAL